MRVLILVHSTKEEPWHSIIEAQKRTWDSVHEDGVDTIYYYSGDTFEQSGKDLFVRCPQEADMSH